MKKPNTGWTTTAKVSDVVDGDTIKVILQKEIVIRITDDEGKFNTPETRKPASDEEIKLGKEAKEFLYQLIFSDGNDTVTVHIPTDGENHLVDVFSIGSRVVGHVFVNDDDVTDLMKKAGFDKNNPTYRENN